MKTTDPRVARLMNMLYQYAASWELGHEESLRVWDDPDGGELRLLMTLRAILGDDPDERVVEIIERKFSEAVPPPAPGARRAPAALSEQTLLGACMRVVAALEQPGRSPDRHARVWTRHADEWPVLHRALGELRQAVRGWSGMR